MKFTVHVVVLKWCRLWLSTVLDCSHWSICFWTSCFSVVWRPLKSTGGVWMWKCCLYMVQRLWHWRGLFTQSGLNHIREKKTISGLSSFLQKYSLANTFFAKNKKDFLKKDNFTSFFLDLSLSTWAQLNYCMSEVFLQRHWGSYFSALQMVYIPTQTIPLKQ